MTPICLINLATSEGRAVRGRPDNNSHWRRLGGILATVAFEGVGCNGKERSPASEEFWFGGGDEENPLHLAGASKKLRDFGAESTSITRFGLAMWL